MKGKCVWSVTLRARAASKFDTLFFLLTAIDAVDTLTAKTATTDPHTSMLWELAAGLASVDAGWGLPETCLVRKVLPGRRE